MSISFHPKGLFTLIGFAAVVWVGVSARTGQIHPAWAIAGVVAYLIVEAALFYGISPFGRTRSG